jgi:hypothetical protein
MANEIHHIESDCRALGWALGCVFASYSEAFNLGTVAAHGVKTVLVSIIFYFSYENLIGPVQAVGCYVHLPQSALNFLAGLPADKIICVSWSSTPIAMLVVSLVAGTMYATSAVQLLCNHVDALYCYVMAFVAGLIAFMFEQGLPALAVYRHSVDFEDILKHVAISQAIVPILVATAIWLELARKRNNYA